MSKETEYDREIAQAAEAWVANLSPDSVWSSDLQRIKSKVQAKWRAQQPQCEWRSIAGASCNEPATQFFILQTGNPKNLRCDKHRIEVGEIADA